MGDCARLTPVWKAKPTNALNHKYDVGALQVLYEAIANDDEACFRQARKVFTI